MKVIIAGGRDFEDYEKLKKVCNLVLKDYPFIGEIVSGNASGADKLGELYATVKKYPIKRFIPNWNKHGKAAGPIRNKAMAEYADILIAFWDGKSRGTINMIETAKDLGLKVYVFGY